MTTFKIYQYICVLSAAITTLPTALNQLPTQPVCSQGEKHPLLKTLFILGNLQGPGFTGTGDIFSFGIAGQSALSEVG